MRVTDAEWTAQQKEYFKQVKRKLNCSRKLRRQILEDLAAAIEDSPEADYAELERRFGTPDQFLQNIKDNMEPEQLAGEKTHHLKIVIVVLLLLAVLLGAGIAWFYVTDGVVIFHTKTTIIYLPEDAPDMEASLEDGIWET